mmetsp:Transcript_25478/g.83226  ORF Transcript_25478/g.83226 Transcript_25478/m.83226 type:complete len:419 (-) Transcript_25478:509-1765(-)
MLTSYLAAAAAAAPDGGPRPNFMIILADDLGFDLAAAYGHPLSVTPHLDRLARSSFVSTGHHAGGATCAPSRAALMTGRNTMAFPNERNNGIGELPTVTDLLKHQGYETGHFGKWHLEKAAAVGAYGMQTVGGAGSRRRRKGHRQELSLANLTAVERARLKEQADEAEQEARRKEEEAPAPTPLCARAAAADRGADRARLWPAMFQAALLCPPASAEARRRHAEAVEAAEAADARDGKELKAAAKAAKAAKAAGNRSREKVHYTLGATPSTKTTPSFCSRAPTSKRSPRDSDVVGAAVAWLRARAGSRPFYANVWLHAPHAPVSLVEAVGRPLCEMLGGTAASVLGATPFGHLLAAGAAVDWGSVVGGPMAAKVRAARAAAEGWARRAGRPYPAGALERALAEYLATVWVVDFQVRQL